MATREKPKQRGCQIQPRCQGCFTASAKPRCLDPSGSKALAFVNPRSETGGLCPRGIVKHALPIGYVRIGQMVWAVGRVTPGVVSIHAISPVAVNARVTGM
jgi:hypothetical protein